MKTRKRILLTSLLVAAGAVAAYAFKSKSVAKEAFKKASRLCHF